MHNLAPIALAAGLATVLAAAPALGDGPKKAPDADACAAQIKRQASGGPSAGAACWRIGPVSLGMTPAQVTALLGAADFEADHVREPLGPKDRRIAYRSAAFVFPRDLHQQLARHPAADVRFHWLQVAYVDGRVAGISNNPALAVESASCNGRAPSMDDGPDKPPVDYSPYRSFAGLKEGDSPARLFRLFGRPFTISTAGDFYNYWTTPLTLEVEEGHVMGFSIGTDRDTVGLEPAIHVALTRDPATCRITGYRRAPESPGES